MNMRDAILLGVLCAGAIGGAIFYALRIHRSTYAVLGVEARFLHTQLQAAGAQLGLDVVSMPVFHDPRTPPDQRWPALPFLRGQRGKYQLAIAPDYYWALTRIENEDFDLQRLALVIRIAAMGSNALAPGLPTDAPLDSSRLQQFWEAQKVRQGTELKDTRKDQHACADLIAGLYDSRRRPMRVSSVRSFSGMVQAIVEYPNPPKVELEGSKLHPSVDPTSLDKILSELVQTADACALAE
jgi:hypothetical protein